MIILILITLFPFYWMLRTAFSTSKSLFDDPASLLPVDFTTGAFARVLGLATPAEAQAEGGSGAAVNFWLFLRNSVIFATVATAGQVFFSALAAYAFARLQLARPGQGVLPVPDRADGAADLHHAAELHPDQEPRPAEHLRRD